MLSKSSKPILFYLFVFLVLFISQPVIAGLLLEQESYLENNPDRKGKGQIYISNNKIKFVAENEDPIIIFDLNKNKLFIIDQKTKQYVESSPKKYVELVQANMTQQKKVLKKELANMPKDKRAQQLKLLEQKRININGDEKAKNWEINKTGESKDIAGFKTQKVELLEDGKVIQDLWVSDKMSEIDLKKLAEFYSEIHKISQGLYLGPENQNRFSKSLSEIYKLGYPMETVDYNLPGHRVEKILSIKEVEIADEDFRPPSGYKKNKI
ncbi:MAG: DUF4412 domain-containing protein [Candidatus Dadabacteria bacterium]|nr:DUF4412 domain-containing protein [Candidatus Dadabacteria bacterium]NIS10166.1 DUF4412 domain-containing protein [Candidatus Dadabacteria bacterium]NIV42556.1 DUF4412 domain-containing protein [Candidatus Dadabacteria bacterium]NIY23078.1 DUF4412 domain-containing protein [Candidatus Dadabacteria bacterium]